MKYKKDEQKQVRRLWFLIDVAIIIVILIIHILTEHIFHDSLYAFFENAMFGRKCFEHIGTVAASISGAVNDIYFAQMSLTFITVSVISVLSDRSRHLYWKDLVQVRLIEPIRSCFYAYTYYAFSTLVFSTVALLLNEPILVMLSFLSDACILSRLTYSIINVFCDRNSQKAKAVKEFNEAKKNDEAAYENILIKLSENTIQRYENKEWDEFIENIEFCVKNCESSETGYIVKSISKRVRADENYEYFKAIIKIVAQEALNVSTEERFEQVEGFYMHVKGEFIQILKSKSDTEWYEEKYKLNDLVDAMMVASRNIMVAYVEKDGVSIQKDKFVGNVSLKRGELDKIYGERLKLLDEGAADYEVEKDFWSDLKSELCIQENEDILHEKVSRGDYSISHFIYPMSAICEILEKYYTPGMDLESDEGSGDAWYAFTIVFAQFPIFKYLKGIECLNEYIKRIKTQYEESEGLLSDSWRGLFGDIIGVEEN
jgi:hypothetical protein